MSKMQADFTHNHDKRRIAVFVRTATAPADDADLSTDARWSKLIAEALANEPDRKVDVIDARGESGWGPGPRPGFNRLVDVVKAGEYALVAVTDWNRITRDVADRKAFLEALKSTGTKLLVDGEVHDPATEAMASAALTEFLTSQSRSRRKKPSTPR